jgi:hypothetical protein
MATKNNGAGGQAAPGGAKPTKIEAVRRVLEALGKETTPRQIQAEVKSRFGLDMTAGHAKTARTEVLRRLARAGNGGR